MLTERRIKILGCIVDEFVQTAEPVGSKTLMEKYELPYSSATIRNEMQALEEDGYLEKTHTSSGRVPSTKGYQYYCENLLKKNPEVDEKMELVLSNIFENSHLDLDDAIQESCKILSQMTNLTTGALGPDANELRLEHIQLFRINERSAVAVFITNSGHTENKVFNFESDVSLEDIENCCNILNQRLKDTLIKDLIPKLEAVKPILAASVQRHEMLFRAFVNAFVKFASENVYFSGKSNMLYQPEFSDIEKLKNLMNMLDDSKMFRQIGSEDEHVIAKIDDNSELTWIDNVAIVSSKFRVNDEEEGKLMVVGPSRMDYDRIVSLLEYVSSYIEKMYGTGRKK